MSSRRKIPLFGAVLLIQLLILSSTGELSPRNPASSLRFDPDHLSIEQREQYTKLKLKGCELTQEVGRPELPVKIVHYLIPEGSTVKKIDVTRGEPQELPGEFEVYPVQKPQILALPGEKQEQIPFTPPDPAVYSSAKSYPEELVKCVSVGNMGGYRIASLLVYPVEYMPNENKLVFYSNIDFRIQLEPGTSHCLKGGTNALEKVARGLIANPEDLTSGISSSKDEFFPYLIITSPSYRTAFQPLADWKTKKGLPARIATTDSIYNDFPGWDSAEKIRNFIQHAYQEWNTQWVLLGGDTEIIPDRIAFAMECEAGMQWDEDSVRADLYYSDLDGTWDLNGNHIYGEVADSVDLYPEVFVGRAPANTLLKVESFVNKIITYEKNPPTDYQLKMLFLGEILWQNPYTDAGIGKNMIDSLHVPPRYDPITKLYESLGNESYSTVMSALNDGYNITNHDGHAWYYIMGVGDGSLYNWDMDALVNGDRQGIIYSIGCWSTAIDYDCIAEHWVNNPDGGGVAFIGNSRYGWGSPGNPGYGYSDRFDATFYRILYEEDIYKIGQTLALDKAYYVGRSLQENVYRIHQYQLNLLGDPEMVLWTDGPGTLSVSLPDSIPVGQSVFNVTVREGEIPVQHARVCVRKGDEIYSSQYTDLNGQTGFSIEALTPGNLEVTVTTHDFIPYEGTSSVYSTDSPFVVYQSYHLLGGNGDQELNPEENLEMTITLRNFGADVAPDVTGTLRTNDAFITVTDSMENFGAIAPGDSASTAETYDFSVSPGCVNGHIVYFDLEIQDSNGRIWNAAIAIPVSTPVIDLLRHAVFDSLEGNDNQVPEPGEAFDLRIWIKNSGLGYGRAVVGSLSTADPYLTLRDTTQDLGDLPPNIVFDRAYVVEIDAGSPAPDFKELWLKMYTEDGYAFTDTMILTVGEVEFTDDMESGQNGWIHGGQLDLWNLSDHKSHSGDHSWYCGNEGSWVYGNDMDCYLLSPEIVLSPVSALTFWHWYDVTIYGVDGLYVEVIHSSGTDTLDYIGSGGALDSLLMGNDWIQEIYDLSAYSYGDTVQIKLSWVTDESDVAEGFYIDDLRVGPCQITPPDVPGLVSPVDGSMINDPTPDFVWEATSGKAGTYGLQYSTDELFAQEVTTVEGLVDTQYAPPTPLTDSIWFWRVQAVNSFGLESGYGGVHFWFRLDTAPPAIPFLLSPGDGIQTEEHTPTFIWSSVIDSPVSYTLEYAVDSTFSSPDIFHLEELTDTTYTVPDTAPLSDTTYYWHVQATDEATNQSGFQETPFRLSVYSESQFIRGDAVGDSELLMSDATFILRYLYVPGSPEPSCFDGADSDDDGLVVMEDAVYILRYLYIPSTPPPPSPFPGCGIDPTPDGLDCQFHPCGQKETGPIRVWKLRGTNLRTRNEN